MQRIGSEDSRLGQPPSGFHRDRRHPFETLLHLIIRKAGVLGQEFRRQPIRLETEKLLDPFTRGFARAFPDVCRRCRKEGPSGLGERFALSLVEWDEAPLAAIDDLPGLGQGHPDHGQMPRQVSGVKDRRVRRMPAQRKGPDHYRRAAVADGPTGNLGQVGVGHRPDRNQHTPHAGVRRKVLATGRAQPCRVAPPPQR